MVVYDPMVLETRRILYRHPLDKNRHAINNSSPEKVGKWKNEYAIEYVVEHVPQHPPKTQLRCA
jgi:hypothetical protein